MMPVGHVYQHESRGLWDMIYQIWHQDHNLFYNNSYSINELKIYCKNNDNIVAFNTLGFMKSNININNLKETSYINKNSNHGIYIKNNYL